MVIKTLMDMDKKKLIYPISVYDCPKGLPTVAMDLIVLVIITEFRTTIAYCPGGWLIVSGRNE